MKKIIILLLMLFSFFCIAGCGEPPVDPDKIVSISINPDTLPEKVEVTKIKNFIDNLALVITYADGSNDYIAFQRSMISEDDLLKLYSVGVHKVTVNYLDLQTEFTVETYEKMAEYYKLTVVYPDETKVLEEINVRWIQSVDFYKSATTIEGESLMTYDEKEYVIRLFNLPNGYTYNPNICTVNKDNKELVIKLIPLLMFPEGVGSTNDPYVVMEGTFALSFDLLSINGMKIYSFTPSESGRYTIESFAEEKYPSNVSCDPYFGFFGEEINFGNVDYSGNQESYININFKYSFEAEAGKTYYFMAFVSLTTDFPATFNISIYR